MDNPLNQDVAQESSPNTTTTLPKSKEYIIQVNSLYVNISSLLMLVSGSIISYTFQLIVVSL